MSDVGRFTLLGGCVVVAERRAFCRLGPLHPRGRLSKGDWRSRVWWTRAVAIILMSVGYFDAMEGAEMSAIFPKRQWSKLLSKSLKNVSSLVYVEEDGYITVSLTLRAFSRRFYPKHLIISELLRRREKLYRCWFSKDVHRTKCQALTIGQPIPCIQQR